MFGFIKKLFGEPVDFKGLVSKGALIIDVRSPAEFKGGHIKGSTNIPVDKIKGKTKELQSKGKAIITVCRSGSRSGMAKSILKSAGIEVYNGGPWNSLQSKLR
jgi:rhodanese-related sulfurtransferase